MPHSTRSRRSRQLVTLAVAIGLTTSLAACSGPAAPKATPTQTESANVQACKEFSGATMTMMEATRTDLYKEPWERARSEVDGAALKATGDVKERLQRLVDNWPDFGQITIYRDVEPANQLLDDIGRACRADNAAVAYRTFSKS